MVGRYGRAEQVKSLWLGGRKRWVADIGLAILFFSSFSGPLNLWDDAASTHGGTECSVAHRKALTDTPEKFLIVSWGIVNVVR